MDQYREKIVTYTHTIKKYFLSRKFKEFDQANKEIIKAKSEMMYAQRFIEFVYPTKEKEKEFENLKKMFSLAYNSYDDFSKAIANIYNYHYTRNSTRKIFVLPRIMFILIIFVSLYNLLSTSIKDTTIILIIVIVILFIVIILIYLFVTKKLNRFWEKIKNKIQI